MTPDQREQLFVKFSQFGTNVPGEGSGLGLLISKNLAQLMEGDIKVESEYGKGTTFLVSLKCLNEEEEEEGLLHLTTDSPSSSSSSAHGSSGDLDREPQRLYK
jgi:hypothetical protein